MKPSSTACLVAGALFGIALLARAKPEKPDMADKMGHHPGPMHSGAGPGHWGAGPGHADSAAVPSGAPSAAASGRGWDARGGQGELAERFRHHRPKPEEAQQRIGELRQTMAARRQAHRELVRAEFGRAALSHPELVAELRKHARRIAFLNRAKLVATTDLEEPKRTTTLARIDKLIAVEQTRHDAAIQKLKAEPGPTPSALAAGSGTPPSPSGAPAASGSAP